LIKITIFIDISDDFPMAIQILCHDINTCADSVAYESGRSGFESPVRSSQRLKNWHLLLPWLAFTIKGLEQDWLVHCQFKVTGWGIMLICGMVLRCAGLSLDQLQQIWQPLSYIALNCW